MHILPDTQYIVCIVIANPSGMLGCVLWQGLAVYLDLPALNLWYVVYNDMAGLLP